MRRLAELTFDHHLDHQAFIRLVSIENIHRGEFIGRLGSLRTLSQPATSLLDELLCAAGSKVSFGTTSMLWTSTS